MSRVQAPQSVTFLVYNNRMPRSRQISNPPLKSTPPVYPVEKPVVPSLGQAIKEGLGFGLGTTVARNLVDSLMFRKKEVPEPEINREFMKCMQDTQNNYEECRSKLNRSTSQ